MNMQEAWSATLTSGFPCQQSNTIAICYATALCDVHANNAGEVQFKMQRYVLVQTKKSADLGA